MKFYISSPNSKRHGMEYKSVAYYRLYSKGINRISKRIHGRKKKNWRKRVLNSLTNQDIYVGNGPFMKAVRTRHIFYHEDSNRLVLIPSLKRMIELEKMKYVEGDDSTIHFRMISHLFTNYQTTHSTHIPNPFLIHHKLIYTIIQNYPQHVNPYPFHPYLHLTIQPYNTTIITTIIPSISLYIIKHPQSPPIKLHSSKSKLSTFSSQSSFLFLSYY